MEGGLYLHEVRGRRVKLLREFGGCLLQRHALFLLFTPRLVPRLVLDWPILELQWQQWPHEGQQGLEETTRVV
jgi:hypothetical protein